MDDLSDREQRCFQYVYDIEVAGSKCYFANGFLVHNSTKIKSHKALRTTIATAISRQMKRTIILTGTPAPNSIMDLFAQIRALDGGTRLETGITKFRRKYCWEEPQRGGYSKWTLKPGAVKEIVSRVEDICLTLDYEGHLEMPELLTNTIAVELPRSARSTYEELADKFYAEVAGGTVSAKNAAVVGMKLRQRGRVPSTLLSMCHWGLTATSRNSAR